MSDHLQHNPQYVRAGGYPPPPYAPYEPYPPTGYAPVAAAASHLVNVPNIGVVKVATVGQRFLARLIDWVIYGVVFALLIVAGVASLSSSTHCDDYGDCHASGGGIGGFILLTLLGFAFALCYEWLMIGLKGATIGKMAMGIKVLRSDNGRVPGLGKAFGREAIIWGVGVIPFVGWLIQILMYLSALFDGSGRNQTWYDRAAGTQVISTR